MQQQLDLFDPKRLKKLSLRQQASDLFQVMREARDTSSKPTTQTSSGANPEVTIAKAMAQKRS